MMLVLLLKMRESQEKGKIRVSGEKEEEEEKKKETSRTLSLDFLFIHRRVRNYEIPKITLLQIKGYYILPSLQKFILEFYKQRKGITNQ